MADRKRINLTVSPETKDEWDSAVEDSTEYSSLSGLIRQSVVHELSEPADAATATRGRETALTEAHTEDLENVTDTLARMESTLSDLDDRLTNVEQEVTATAQADLKNQVFEALPEYQSEDGSDGKSAEEIAEEVGADRDRVHSVLIQLEGQTSLVQAVADIEGQPFYAQMDEE